MFEAYDDWWVRAQLTIYIILYAMVRLHIGQVSEYCQLPVIAMQYVHCVKDCTWLRLISFEAKQVPPGIFCWTRGSWRQDITFLRF
jgi:hypothetical protein